MELCHLLLLRTVRYHGGPSPPRPPPRQLISPFSLERELCPAAEALQADAAGKELPLLVLLGNVGQQVRQGLVGENVFRIVDSEH